MIVENAENVGNNFEPPALSWRRCCFEPDIEARHLRAGCDLLCRDVLFVGLARPISRWFAANFPMPSVCAWIKSLPPYPCLALFSIPVILLKPVNRFALAPSRFVAILLSGSCRRWRGGRPRISSEVRALIVRMSQESFLWGAPRIHGELLKLGFDVSQATVSRYMPRRGYPPTQT